MSLAKKLGLKPGMKMRILAKPSGMDLEGVATTTSANAEAVLAFAMTLAEVDAKLRPAIEAARNDRIAWIAYPKAGQLETDLNRDILWKHLRSKR